MPSENVLPDARVEIHKLQDLTVCYQSLSYFYGEQLRQVSTYDLFSSQQPIDEQAFQSL
jgi:hypothetical protein